MSGDLVKIDIKEKLKLKVLQGFLELIPEEELDAMVEGTIKVFKEKEMPQMIIEICKEIFKEKYEADVRALITTEYDGEKQVYKKIEEIIKKNAPELLATILSSGFLNMENAIRGSLSRGY